MLRELPRTLSLWTCPFSLFSFICESWSGLLSLISGWMTIHSNLRIRPNTISPDNTDWLIFLKNSASERFNSNSYTSTLKLTVLFIIRNYFILIISTSIHPIYSPHLFLIQINIFCSQTAPIYLSESNDIMLTSSMILILEYKPLPDWLSIECTVCASHTLIVHDTEC